MGESVLIMNAQIFCGDCLELMKDIPDGSVDLILTDPPYLISKKSGFNSGGSWNNAQDKKFQKTPPKTDFGEWDKKEIDFDEVFKEFRRILKKGGTCICFFDIWKMQTLKEIAEKNRFKQFRLVRWDKSNPVPVNSKINYLSNVTEYCLVAVKGSKPTFNSEYNKGIYCYPICQGSERTEHPTQKPLKLMQELLFIHSNDNDVIFDPFMGSGTTGVACVNTGRKFIGIELDPTYFETAKKRLEEAEVKKHGA